MEQGVHRRPIRRRCRPAIRQVRTAIIQAYESVIKRASQLSDKHLKEGMFRRGHAGAYTAITAALLDTNRWLTHSQMIGQSEAAEIGLNVDYRTGSDPEWQIWWRIHCRPRLALDPSGARKLFESRTPDMVS